MQVMACMTHRTGIHVGIQMAFHNIANRVLCWDNFAEAQQVGKARDATVNADLCSVLKKGVHLVHNVSR